LNTIPEDNDGVEHFAIRLYLHERTGANFTAKLKSPGQLLSEHRIMMMENWITKQKTLDGLVAELQVEEYLLKLMRA
jgi:hypothetical protein